MSAVVVVTAVSERIGTNFTMETNSCVLYEEHHVSAYEDDDVCEEAVSTPTTGPFWGQAEAGRSGKASANVLKQPDLRNRLREGGIFCL